MRGRWSAPATWVTISTLAVFATTLWVATGTPGPLLTADDLAYFGLAYTLAGEGSAPMPPQAPYGVLYPVLLVPGWRLGLDESEMLVWARVINSICVAALVPVLFGLVRRVTDASMRSALAAATAAALLPALLLTASIVWTETLLALLVAVVGLALARLWDNGGLGWVLVSVAGSVAMFAAHPRMGMASVAAIVAAAFALYPTGWKRFGTIIAIGVVGLGFAELARARLADAAFASEGTYDAADLASRRGLDLVPQMSQHGLGALAYLAMAATGIGLWGLVRLARRPGAGWSIIGVGVGVLVVASWFLTGVPRADKWLHGRYIEVMASLLVAVGLASLHHLKGRAAAVVLFAVPAAAGVFAAWNGPGDTWADVRSPVMMLGVEVSGAPYGGSIFEPGAAASTAILVGGCAWLLARRFSTEAAAALVAAAALWGVHSGDATLDNLYADTAMGEVERELPADEPITEVFLDVDVVSPNLSNAVAWRAGFDRSVIEPTSNTSHILVDSDASTPDGSELIADLGSARLWRLPGGD